MDAWMLALLAMTAPNGQQAPAKPAAEERAPVVFAVRLGPQLGPRFGYTVGLDIELNRLSMGPGWSTRFDLDVLWQPRGGALFNNVNTLFGGTINQVYSHWEAGGRRIYGGFGIGAYGVPIPDGDDPSDYSRFYTARNRFGGKLLFGAQFNSTAGVELNLHMLESSRPLLTLQARITL